MKAGSNLDSQKSTTAEQGISWNTSQIGNIRTGAAITRGRQIVYVGINSAEHVGEPGEWTCRRNRSSPRGRAPGMDIQSISGFGDVPRYCKLRMQKGWMMAKVEVRLPQWGMGMTDGEVVEWHRQVGDRVQEGDPLAEIETAKVTEILESPVSGTLIQILVNASETAEVRDVLAVIETGDAD